jgi:hypothetical protein
MAKEGRRTMQSTPKLASTPLPRTNREGTRTYRMEEVVYQAVTVGAILLVLGSLWIF